MELNSTHLFQLKYAYILLFTVPHFLEVVLAVARTPHLLLRTLEGG